MILYCAVAFSSLWMAQTPSHDCAYYRIVKLLSVAAQQYAG